MLLLALPLVFAACDVDYAPSVWAGEVVGQTTSWAIGSGRTSYSESRYVGWHAPYAWHEGWRPSWHHDQRGHGHRRAARPPLDAPTVVVHQPGYYAQVGDEEIWVPESFGTEPLNTITRHARGRRHGDQPAAREAPSFGPRSR